MKILVLGATGMLGRMVYHYLKQHSEFEVVGTYRRNEDHAPDLLRFDVEGELDAAFAAVGTQWDYIVNCIGIIKPYCKDHDLAGVRRAVLVNSLFPHRLGTWTTQHNIRVIQIATDCVYSGTKGGYVETDLHDALDVYGKSKSLGETFDGNVLHIRTSIIGPELRGKLSLLDWFRAQPDGAVLKGFTHHRWNGLTTLRFAQLCEQIIVQDAFDKLVAEHFVHHYVPADVVTKFELLVAMKQVFHKQVEITAVGDIGAPVDRSLSSKFSQLEKILPSMTIREDLEQLRMYMQKHEID